MGNPDLLFIFTLTGNWKWKTIIKGQTYKDVCDALMFATRKLEEEWKAHNEIARDEEKFPEDQRTRVWINYQPMSVQIEEIYID